MIADGAGNDIFSLGKAANSSDRNLHDYATIRDFNPSDDLIQLSGKNNYVIGINNGNSEIYLDSNHNSILDDSDNLIVVVNNASNLDLNAAYFDLV